MIAERIFRVIFGLELLAFAARTTMIAGDAFIDGRGLDAMRLGLLASGELLAGGLLLVARRASKVNFTPWPVALTLAGTFGLLFAQLDKGRELIPAELALGIQLAGIVLQLSAKLWLGRSFGVLPAARGLVTSGPYSLVRHPMYLGYLIGHLGWLLVSFTPLNALLLVGLHTVQCLRIHEEEKVLREDPTFAAYATRVRYRLLPRVF